jgi:hypothetical protein
MKEISNKKIRENKKGDIPVTVLVLGIFVVCVLAILSFVHSDIQIKNNFSGIKVMEKANIEIERGNLNHYYGEKRVKVIVPGFSLDWIKEKIIFSVDYNP